MFVYYEEKYYSANRDKGGIQAILYNTGFSLSSKWEYFFKENKR